MVPSVRDEIPRCSSRSQSETGAEISTILSGGLVCGLSDEKGTSLAKPGEEGGERDGENQEVAKVYVDVLVDTVRRMSLLPSDMLAQKFRCVTAPACPPARTECLPPPPGDTLTTD